MPGGTARQTGAAHDAFELGWINTAGAAGGKEITMTAPCPSSCPPPLTRLGAMQ
jgi:hypothetical protein